MSTLLHPPSMVMDRPLRGDGFGQMLLDCYAAGPVRGTHRQVVERVDGYVSVEDAYRYFSAPGEWVQAEQVALDVAGGRVLDIGCAAGRHMLEAQARGCECVGIDPSAGAVQVARTQGLDVRPGTILQPGEGLGTFDTLFLLGGNLGLLGSRTQAPKVLARLAELARPGAQILANGHDPYAAPDADHIAYHRHNAAAGRLPGQVLMRVRYGRLTSDWFDRLLLSPDELAELVQGSPWELQSCSAYGPTGFYLTRLTLRDDTCAPTAAPHPRPSERPPANAERPDPPNSTSSTITAC